MAQENESYTNSRPDDVRMGEHTPDENPLGGKLNQILSDPESMRKLSQMANALAGSGMLDNLGIGKNADRTENDQTGDGAYGGSGSEKQEGSDTAAAAAAVIRELTAGKKTDGGNKAARTAGTVIQTSTRRFYAHCVRISVSRNASGSTEC
ncbi:MAG: hypothetical protein ACI3XM_09730 [Eubacteriales bacterium]